jgi:hypothetical protein
LLFRHYDLGFFGLVESLTLDILDNYEQTNLMIVTDSLSYFPILKNEQISVVYLSYFLIIDLAMHCLTDMEI